MQSLERLIEKFLVTLRRLDGDWELMQSMTAITLEDLPPMVEKLY